ncbi:MAG: TetR family transcriptional regulator [Bdellovibrionales bacterium]|nr:TetR family transcriptional regulator [Bdellovibrionales bacterium]
MKSELRRAKILDAAIKIIAKKGVSTLTFERVGKMAGMARSHVIYYYSNRDTLIIEAIRFATMNAKEIILAHLGETSSGEAALVKYIEGNFRWVTQEAHDLSLYCLLYYQSTIEKKYSELHEEIREVGYEIVRKILGSIEGIPASAVPDLSVNILGVITGNIVDAVSLDRQHLLRSVRLKQTIKAVEALLEGARK